MSRIPTLIDNPDGSIRTVNLKRLNEMPFHLLSNVPNNVMQVPAQGSSQPTIMSISGEGPAQIHSFASENFDPRLLILLQIQDGQSIRALMNRACHVNTIFGNFNPGNRPYPLPEALYVDEQRGIVITATDFSGAANTFRPSLLTARFLSRIADPSMEKVRSRMEQRQYLSLPGFLTLDNGKSVLAAGGTNMETITVGQDAHFEIFQITAFSDGVFDFNLVDLDTGESFVQAPLSQDFPISSNLITGNAGFPFRLHEPRFCELRSKIGVTLTDRSGAPNTVFFTLGGRSLADRMWS
jgi:hypothetical protein